MCQFWDKKLLLLLLFFLFNKEEGLFSSQFWKFKIQDQEAPLASGEGLMADGITLGWEYAGRALMGANNHISKWEARECCY